MWNNPAFALVGIGSYLAVSIVLPTLLGRFLDARYETDPALTLLGLLLPEIIGGSVILEVMFNWPGMGRLFFESMLSRDYPTIMALSFVTACLVLLGTLIADLSYIFVDPRVSYD